MQKDIIAGIRTPDVIERSIARIPFYQQFDTIKIDTSGKIAEVLQTKFFFRTIIVDSSRKGIMICLLPQLIMVYEPTEFVSILKTENEAEYVSKMEGIDIFLRGGCL